MEDIMINVINVSMRFNLGIEKGFSIKQGFVDMFNKEKSIKRKKNFGPLETLIFKLKKVK